MAAPFPPVSPTLTQEQIDYITATTTMRGAAYTPNYTFVSTKLVGDGRWLEIAIMSGEDTDTDSRKGQQTWWEPGNENLFHALVDDILTTLERRLSHKN